MGKRTYRSYEQWIALIRQQQKSGMSVAAFCKQNNLHTKYFYKRRRELLPDKPPEPSPFIKLNRQDNQPVMTQHASVPIASLQWNKTRLDLYTPVDPSWIATLHKVLS